MKNIYTNSAGIGPIAIPAIKGIADALALGTAAYGLSQTEQDYQTEFLRNHGMVDPREEAMRELISKPDILKTTTYIPRRHTSYISQPIVTPETEWYVPNPGTIYGGIIPEVEIISAPKAESRLGDAIGVLTGKKSISRDSTQTNQRDSVQNNRDTTKRNTPQNNNKSSEDDAKYFDWSKDMSWSTPTESILKYVFKPRPGRIPLWRIGLNWAPLIGGGYYLGKSFGWWGNDKSTSEDTSSDDGWGK